MATVTTIATTDVVKAARSDAVSDVVALIRDENIGSVVIEEKDLPVEIVTDRQIALGIADDPEVGHKAIDSVMTRDLIRVPETASVFEDVQTISEASVGRTGIVDVNGELVGQVALDDVPYVIKEQLDLSEHALAAQSDRY